LTKRGIGDISACSSSAVTASCVHLSLIGSRSGAFQRGIDKAPTFPVSPQRVVQKHHFAIPQMWVLAKVSYYHL